MAATACAERPVTAPMERSDQWGWVARMRAAAAERSDGVKGSPWVELAVTASTKASSGVPSKNRAEMWVAPRSTATRSRYVPSMTRIEERWTMTGGSSPGHAASARRWSEFPAAERGESAGRRSAIGTGTAGERRSGPGASNGSGNAAVLRASPD
ncbi:hypothetical protein GCM10023347_11310 [Streptomyces chumphonensis]